MNRREMIALVGGGVATWPLSARAQPPNRPKVVGVLSSVRPGRTVHLQRGLYDLGYREGNNIALEQRSALGQYDRLNDLATELVALKIDVLVAATPPAVLSAQRATKTIPIVFVLVSDPIGLGLVTSVARPGGNISGIAMAFEFVSAKRFELFKEAIGFSNVAVIVNPTDPVGTRFTLKEVDVAATRLGVRVHPIEVGSPDELRGAFSGIANAGIKAVWVAIDATLWTERNQIAELASHHRMATMFGVREHVEVGGLMSYGVDLDAPYYRAATFVDKILRGEKVGDLPVEQPTKFEFLINLKTAKALGLDIPSKVLALADEVIE